jgi:hypothetical protein
MMFVIEVEVDKGRERTELSRVMRNVEFRVLEEVVISLPTQTIVLDFQTLLYVSSILNAISLVSHSLRTTQDVEGSGEYKWTRHAFRFKLTLLSSNPVQTGSTDSMPQCSWNLSVHALPTE